MYPEQWKQLIHPKIIDGYYISSNGRIRYKQNEPYTPDYHSSNGYDYALFILKDEYRTIGNVSQLFPIDDLVGLVFLSYDPSMKGKEVKINHIDGNTRNNNLSNLEWIEDIEEWKEMKFVMTSGDGIELHSDPKSYMISNKCRVWSNITNKMLSPNVDDGYLKISVSMFDASNILRGQRHIKLHRAMALTFDLPGWSEDRYMINHINGIRGDNRLKNIEWCSCKENVKHAFTTGLEVNPKGQEHPRSKFTDHQRKCIYEILKTLKYTPPRLLTDLISERLPNISHDDVKYAKQVIKKTEGFEFPMLPKYGNMLKMSEEEIDSVRKVVYKIFDDYGITDTEVYINEYRKENQTNKTE